MINLTGYSQFSIQEVIPDTANKQIIITTNFKVDPKTVDKSTVAFYQYSKTELAEYDLKVDNKTITIILKDYPEPSVQYYLKINRIQDALHRNLSTFYGSFIEFKKDVATKVTIVKPALRETLTTRVFEIQLKISEPIVTPKIMSRIVTDNGDGSVSGDVTIPGGGIGTGGNGSGNNNETGGNGTGDSNNDNDSGTNTNPDSNENENSGNGGNNQPPNVDDNNNNDNNNTQQPGENESANPSEPGVLTYVIEICSDSAFFGDKTRISCTPKGVSLGTNIENDGIDFIPQNNWISGDTLSITGSINHEGQVYIRARAQESENLVGDWSDLHSFNIYTIPMDSIETNFLENYLTTYDMFDEESFMTPEQVKEYKKVIETVDRSSSYTTEPNFFIEFNKEIRIPLSEEEIETIMEEMDEPIDEAMGVYPDNHPGPDFDSDMMVTQEGLVLLGIVTGFRKGMK